MDAAPLRRPARKAAAMTLTEAFWDYPATIHLLPDERRRRRVLSRYLEAECAVAQAHGTLLGVTDDGEVLGAAAWTAPEANRGGHQPLPPATLLLPALPWALPAVGEALRGQRANHGRRPDDEHFYLQLIGVRPAWQGRGIGRRLLAGLLAAADQCRAGCYLTTTEAGRLAFYAQAGFEIMDTYRPTPSWPETWALWRPPA